MNSRERIIEALNHREPDRIPIWFGTAATGAVEKVYEEMGEHEDIEFWKQVTSFFDTFKFDERMLKRMHSDVRALPLGCAGGKNWYPSKIYPDGTFTNIYNLRFKKCGYFSSAIVENPLAFANTVKDIENYEWPDNKAIASIASEGLEEEAKYLKNETEYAVLGEPLWSHIELAQWLRGLDNWLIDTVKRPEMIEALLKKLFDYAVPIYDTYFKTVGKYLDVVFIGDDLGAQDRPLTRPEIFKELLKPWLKKRIEYIKERTNNTKVILHSCGSIYQLLPDLVDIGLDGIHPLQPFAKNMEPERLKAEFGNKLVFLGGLDHQHILNQSLDEVIDFVKRLIKVYGPGGGYIFAPTHDIPPVPIENIFGAFDYVYENGKYPINTNL